MVSLCLVQGHCHNYFVVKKQTGKMCVSDHTWLSANVGGDVRESQSSPDSVREAPTHRSTSPVIIRNLPGPSTVIGDQGNSGTNPLTGQRQRRRGVSGPPTGRNPLSVPWFVISFLHLEIYDTQEAMENFVFPDEIKTKLMTKCMNWYEFSYFDWNSAKKLQKVIFIFTEQTGKQAFMFWTTTRREMHQSKKAQHMDLLTSTY